jgi:hypothetical protein
MDHYRFGCNSYIALIFIYLALHTSVATAQLGFFQLFFSFFITENAVINITMQEMVTNIPPLHAFQIYKKIFKYMQPIWKYSKNNMWFF